MTDRVAQPHSHATDIQRLSWALRSVLTDQFDVAHSTLQIEHAECPDDA